MFGARLIVFLLSKSRTFRCQIQPDYIAKSTLKFWETAFKQGKNIDESLKLYNKNTVYREKELYNRSPKSASYFAPKNKK